MLGPTNPKTVEARVLHPWIRGCFGKDSEDIDGDIKTVNGGYEVQGINFILPYEEISVVTNTNIEIQNFQTYIFNILNRRLMVLSLPHFR